MNLTPIDFDSFHDATLAVFTTCATPTREPDHISESRSMYWDEAGGVVRLSDHWAGQHGCTSQRSCVWSIDKDLAWGQAAAGWCAYTAFIHRRRVPVWHTTSPDDRDLAARLVAGRGAIPAGEWTADKGIAALGNRGDARLYRSEPRRCTTVQQERRPDRDHRPPDRCFPADRGRRGTGEGRGDMVMTSIDAFWPVLVANLCLTSRDLAEIGGFSEKFARDLLSGRKPFPEDVRAALEDIQDDIDVMTDSLVADIKEGVRVIHVYRTTDEMRSLFPEWPGRGRATGGFVGPHRIAALGAWEHARDAEIPAVLHFISVRSGSVAVPSDSVQ